MSVRWRLVLLIVFATGVPALTGLLVTRHFVNRTLAVALSPDLDAALDAGVRQARASYREQRLRLDARADSLAGAWQAAVGERDRFLGDAGRWLQPTDRLELREADAEAWLAQAGDLPAVGLEEPSHAAPVTMAASVGLDDGTQLVLTTPVESGWRDDATLLAGQLQVIRGLRLQQADLEQAFTLNYLVILVLALALSLGLAWWLGNGITAPVRRLVQGTEAVARGRWDVQVTGAGGGELGRLTDRFNAMVRTLELQSRRLVDLEKMAGWQEMARALAHEVKNPLTPIQLTVEEIRARCPEDDPEYAALVKECTRIILEEVASLREVVTRFREFSRPVALAPEPVDLISLVADVAALQRDLEVSTQLPDALDPVPVDPVRLRQVLMNLATNAREATSDVDGSRLAVSLVADGPWAMITLEDNGPGVPVDQRERIFEPYRSGRAGGLGLGLALVKGIIMAHGGDITVDRSPTLGGARFTITLPRRAVAPEEGNHA